MILLSSEILLHLKAIQITSGYLLILGLLVISFWAIWWWKAGLAIKDKILWDNKIPWDDVYWEFNMSCLSLSIVSAFAGVAMVTKIFEWFGWVDL